MNDGKICVSVCGETADEVVRLSTTATDAADVVEIRFDCLRPEETDRLLDKLGEIRKQLVITFRPEEQGGRRRLTVDDRVAFWERLRSSLNGRRVIVDHEFDLQVPNAPENTIISIHDFRGDDPDLKNEIDVLTLRPESTIKVAVAVTDAAEAIDVWKLLEKSSKPVVPIAMGEAGKWTRILSLAHGSPMTYASLNAGSETAPGQISATDLRDVFRVKQLDRTTKVFGLIAGETSYSLSPFMHNAAFATTGQNSVFVPLKVNDLDSFIRRMVRPDTREVELNFCGFAVTNPHKQSIMKHLADIDDTARKIGAVNTVSIEEGKLVGLNTDVVGFLDPLKRVSGNLSGARVAVVGAGGAARACAYALREEGCRVTVLARDKRKADSLAGEFDIDTAELGSERLDYDILVNATPVGTRGEQETESIATAGELGGVGLVYDLVYNPTETRLIREAGSAGVRTLGGIEMLVAQGARQFEIWTGDEAPVDVMRTAVASRLGE